jgi:hypothetical protein
LNRQQNTAFKLVRILYWDFGTWYWVSGIGYLDFGFWILLWAFPQGSGHTLQSFIGKMPQKVFPLLPLTFRFTFKEFKRKSSLSLNFFFCFFFSLLVCGKGWGELLSLIDI